MAKISKMNTHRVKGRSMTKAQKQQRVLQKSGRASTVSKITDHTSKGTGRYAKRSSTPLTSKQAYKLEKRSLINERAGLETKPELIKAAGQALAMNISPAASSYGATAGTAKIIEANNKVDNNISSLINGGVDQAGRDNDEEVENDYLPGGGSIR